MCYLLGYFITFRFIEVQCITFYGLTIFRDGEFYEVGEGLPQASIV